MTRLTDDELARAADIGSARMLRAIRATESGGNARAVRFEVHLWEHHHRETVMRLPAMPMRLSAAWYNARSSAIIATGQFPYTPARAIVDKPGPSRVAVESDRAAMDRARKIDAEKAVLCSSFGLYQELGATLLPITPGDANADVAAFDADPEGVSELLLVAWFNKNPQAAGAARRLDFGALARFYNGPSNVERYSPILRRNYYAQR